MTSTGAIANPTEHARLDMVSHQPSDPEGNGLV
jgi:hypothetical protein